MPASTRGRRVASWRRPTFWLLLLAAMFLILPMLVAGEDAAAVAPPAEGAAAAPVGEVKVDQPPAEPVLTEEQKKAKEEEEKKKKEEEQKAAAVKAAAEKAAADKAASEKAVADLAVADKAAADEIKKAAEEKERLQKQNAELLARAEKAEKENKEKEDKIKQTWEERQKFESEKNEKQTELDKIRGDLEGARRDFKDKESLLDKTNKELNDARTKITALMIVQEDLMKQKDNLHLTYSELREKYENPELQHYVTKRAAIFYKNNPGLQGAVNKTSELLIPTLEAGTLQYAILLNSTHTAIKSNLHPFIGEHSHWVSGFISYGLFFIPLFLSVYCLISVRAVLKVRGLIMFCHMYFALCSTIAAGMVIYFKVDPLRLLHESNAGTYVWTQLILGVVFLAYFLLQCLALCQSKALDLWISRVVQLLAVTVIGGLYYATVFTPAMLDHPPLMMSQRGLLIFYGIPAFVFGIMLFIEKAQGDELSSSGRKKDYGNKEEMEILLTTDDKKVGGTKIQMSGLNGMLSAGLKDEEQGKDA